MKKICILLLAMIACMASGVAQIVTTSPEILQESSKNVVLTYHAEQGNGGLKGLPSSTAVYAHIGVITTKSTGAADWKYVVADWGTNVDKAKMTYVSPNTYSLNIGDIRSYFGITDANERVKQIALVFRTADGSKEGKTAGGGDIFVDIHEEGFSLQLISDVTNIVTSATTVNFTVVATEESAMSLSVNNTVIGSVDKGTKIETSYRIENTGNYTVVATADNGKETLTETLSITFPKPSVAGTYPGGVPKMGAVKNSDGSVTFCLAAPQKTSVILVPSWDDYQILDKNTMQYQDYQGQRYFFTTVTGLKDDVWYPYYYIVDAQYKVADPYARLVLDNYSDKWLDPTIWPDMPKYPYDKVDDTMMAVYRGDFETDYKFSDFKIPDHSNLIIYEMLFRDFTGDEVQANGNGTIRKALGDKLQYLKELGVNAIELMPVMEFNANNSWGYNTNFYFAPDKAYGSPTDLKEFVDWCHKLGMAVILDIVFNQTDGLHPWYVMYGGYGNVANNPFYNATAPHDYSVLNDWKQEHPLVLQQEIDALQFWLKVYNVDGFRFDLVKGLGTSYPGNTDGYNASRVERMKILHAAMKEIKPDAIHINENLAGSQEENEMANDGQLNWANINYNACQYAMGYGSGSNTLRFNAVNDSRNWGSTVSYAESHDEERMAYKQLVYGASGVKGNHANSMKRLGQVAVQMLLQPGPKMIWQFGELGADQTEKTSTGNDVDPKRVVWSYLDDPDRKALHDTYQALCNFRTQNPELFSNTATVTVGGFGDNVTSNRTIRVTNGDQEVIAFLNTRLGGANNSASATSTKLNANNCQLITAHKDFNGNLNGTGTSVSVSLPPHGYAVYATKNTAGVDNVTADNDGNFVSVYGSNGEITVVGEYSSVQVFDLSGRLQPLSGLTPGLYIVTVDGTNHKVMVN